MVFHAVHSLVAVLPPATSAALFLFLLPSLAYPQDQDAPLYPRVGLSIGGGYSRTSLDPSLPRDLKNHENHTDDGFLTGSAGTTDLDRVQINAIQPQIGVTYRLGYRNLALVATYMPEFRASSSGRLEIQQPNDPRPAASGSFVYSKLSEVRTSQIAALGLGFAFPVSAGHGWWLETQGLVTTGRWDMTFEKGWSRFGQDQAAIPSKASGFDLSPRFVVGLRTSTVGFDVGVSYRQLRFSHDFPGLEDHTAGGFSVSVGARVNIALTED